MIQLVSLLAIVAAATLALICLVALPLAFAVLLSAVVVGSFVLWIWMLVDAIRNDELNGWARVGWAMLIWFTHWIGALIYLCIARRGQLRPRHPGTIAS